MMLSTKTWLLAASAVAAISATGAQAQVTLPAPVPAATDTQDAALHAAGATSIQNILVQMQNCFGGADQKLGNNSGGLSTIANGLYSPTSPTAANPVFDCSTQNVQPNFVAEYIGTGSGTGISYWNTFSNQLPGTTSSNKNPFGTWNRVNFAFSDGPISLANLTTYNTNNATVKAGPAIQFPLFALPVALAYNPVYGEVVKGGTVTQLKFNVKSTYVTKGYNGLPNGGLRLNKAAYCNIFTGNLTNWNDPRLKTLNGNQSLQDPADDAARWTNTGVPIRLVGRVDNSGTTDIFTRHLAEVCTGQAGVTLNKFAVNEQALPYWTGSTIDMRGFRSDTRYFPGSTKANAAGANASNAAYQSLSGAFFNRTTQTIDTTQGAEAAGLFMLADGSGGVRDAINYQPHPTTEGQVILNGKLGYISADFIVPVPGATLYAAALQVGTSATSFAGPSAANATAAVGTILPPQTTASSGAYATTDTRQVLADDGVTLENVDRANPQHWTKVLYKPFNGGVQSTVTLANPAKGYAITGTTQFLGYTCYANAANRLNVVHFLAFTLGKVTKTSTNAAVSGNTFRGTGATALGLIPQQNLTLVPTAWQNAIYNTFLTNLATGGLGARNLWIQNKLPTSAATLATTTGNTNVCTAGQGD